MRQAPCGGTTLQESGTRRMIRILIIEDSPDAEAVLKGHIDRYAAETGEDFQVEWLTTAFDFVEGGTSADLIFMDIGLPGINGMEAAKALRSYDTETTLIFVTDLAQYAVKGYEVDALDFMVKPVSYPDFALRMSRAMSVIKRNTGRSVFASTKDGLRVMPISQISYVEVVRHNLIYHLVDGEEPFSIRGSLGKVEEDLADTTFVRISKSCIVNMDHVRKISGTDVNLSTGETVYISRTWRKEALDAIADYYGGNA